MYFVGIDLAWSQKNGSGVVVLEGNKQKAEFISGTVLLSNEDIINYLKEKVGNKPAFVAIDAPLIVPNRKGRRLAEEEVGKLFRKYDAGAHPANRTRLSEWSGDVRGETLTGLLEKEGFIHDPNIKRFENSRKLFEVYPHPSMVVLFNLERILRYKAKPKRDYQFRWKEFMRYQKYLSDLENAKPSLILPDEITKEDVKKLKAKKLKSFEDLLDAVFCAYISYYTWFSPEKCAVLGNMEKGYILTPIFDSMKGQLKETQSKLLM